MVGVICLMVARIIFSVHDAGAVLFYKAWAGEFGQLIIKSSAPFSVFYSIEGREYPVLSIKYSKRRKGDGLIFLL